MLEGEMWDVNEGGIKSFDALDSREKTMATLEDRWWPQTAKQDEDKIWKRIRILRWRTVIEGSHRFFYICLPKNHVQIKDIKA